MKRPSDGQAALDEIKAYVRRVASSVDFEALYLTGLPEDELDAAITEIARTMAANLATLGRGSHIQLGLGHAYAEVICERVAELEATGRGRA